MLAFRRQKWSAKLSQKTPLYPSTALYYEIVLVIGQKIENRSDRRPLFLEKRPTMPCRLYSNKIHTSQEVKHQQTLVIPVKINLGKKYTFSFRTPLLFLDLFAFSFFFFFWAQVSLAIQYIYIYYFLKLFTELIW